MTTRRHHQGPWRVSMTSAHTVTVPDGLLRSWQVRPGDPIELAMEGNLLRLQPAGTPDRAVLARVLPHDAREVTS